MQTKARTGLPSPKSIDVHGDDDIDDAADLAADALAFHLKPMFGAAVIVGDAFPARRSGMTFDPRALCRWRSINRNSRACSP